MFFYVVIARINGIEMKELVLTFDGGAKPNPGKGYGSYNIWIEGIEGPSYGKSEEFYGDNLTSNQAEYMAVISGVGKIIELFGNECRVLIKGDSELVLKQIKGEYRVKNEKLMPLNQKLMESLKRLGNYDVQHRPREESVEEFGH